MDIRAAHLGATSARASPRIERRPKFSRRACECSIDLHPAVIDNAKSGMTRKSNNWGYYILTTRQAKLPPSWRWRAYSAGQADGCDCRELRLPTLSSRTVSWSIGPCRISQNTCPRAIAARVIFAVSRFNTCYEYGNCDLEFS